MSCFQFPSQLNNSYSAPSLANTTHLEATHAIHNLPPSLSDNNQPDNGSNGKDDKSTQRLICDMNEQCVETKVELAQNDERPELRSDVHHTSH